MFGTIVLVIYLVQSVKTQIQNDLVLLGHLETNREELELKCVTKQIDKAIIWNTPIEEKFIPKASSIDQQFIEPNNWVMESSYNRNFGLVLDERWEDFPTKFNSKWRRHNEKVNKRSKSYIPISVKLEVQLDIEICYDIFRQSPFPINCYVIILRSNGEIMSMAKNCELFSDECKATLIQNYTKKINKNEWSHFTVILDNKNRSISVVFEGDETPFIHFQNDTLANDRNYIVMEGNERNLGNAFWKFHDYKVYVLEDQLINKDHLITSLFPTGNSLCLSMYVSICDTCTMMLLIKENQNNSLIYEEQYSKAKEGFWQKIKFSASGLNNEIGYSIFIKIAGTLKETDQFFLSHFRKHKSRICFQEFRYSLLKINVTDQLKVSCQYLQDDRKNNETAVIKIQEPSLIPENACKADAVGSTCIPCLSIFKQQCESTIICENNGCHCSQGYEGALCDFPLRDVWDVSWNSSDTTISLEWKAPSKSNKTNVGYIVSYQHNKYLQCFDEDKNSSGKITTEDTKILLKDLNPYSEYFVRIERSTKFAGEMYEALLSTKPGKLEKGAIEIISKEINTTDVTLYFKRNCEKFKAPIKIELLLNCSQDWCNQKKIIDLFEATYSIFNLHPFTEYYLEFREFGEETALLTDRVKTKPGTPRWVTNFEVYEKGHSSLLMRWTPSEPATGLVEKYSFSAQSEKYNVGPIDIKAHRCEIWTSMMCAEMHLEDVMEGTELILSIRFKNENVDTWSFPTTTHATTGESVPEGPKILYAIWDSGYNLTVRWQHPNKTNGRLESFLIVIKTSDSDKRIFTFPVVKYNLTYAFKEVLYPESPNYTIAIFAENRFIITASPPAVIVILNPPKQPKITETISYEEYTNNTIKVFIPPPIDVQYKSYTYVFVSETEATNCSQSNSLSQFIKDFKECNVWFAMEILNQNKQEEIVIGDKSRQYITNLRESSRNRELKPYTKYKLYLVIVNQNNNFTRFSVTKGIQVYLEPTKVILPCYTSCKLRFKPKKDPQSSSNVYIIQYKEINQTSWTKTNNTLSFTNHSETLDVFKKSTSYNLRIYLVKGAELEMQMPELNFTTSCQNIQLENITIVARNISAYLYLIPYYEKEICDLKYYNLTVQILGHEYNKTLKAFNRIEYLKPLTTYNVTISSKNHSIFTNFTTDEGFPEKVENITWNSTETTISLEWKEPKLTNGKIRGYQISYQHSLYKSCIYIESDDESNGKTTAKNTKFFLEKLNPNSNYTVSINAFTKLPGKLVETQVSTKPTDELNADAYKISIDEYDNTISLHFWPNCKKIKGPLLIGVMLTCSKSWCNETTNLTIDPLIINYHIRNLQAFTEYHLEFKLLNSVQSIDLFSKTITTLTTQPRVPNPVTHFEIYGRTEEGLLLRWKPPEPPTGIIEDYFLSANYYHDGIWTDLDIEDSNWGTCKDWAVLMCIEIKGVPNELKSHISITAKNQNVKTLSKSVTAVIAASFSLENPQPKSTIYQLLIILTVLFAVIVLLLIFYIYYVRRKNTRISAAGNMQVTYTSVEK